MAFKGMFDGSVEIGQNREERANQMAMQQQRIQAQMAMQSQQLKARSAMQQSQLNASIAQSDKDREMKQNQFAVSTDMGNKKLDMAQNQFDTTSGLEQEKFDIDKSIKADQQKMAQLGFEAAQAEFDEDKVRRAALTSFRQSAFATGILSAQLNGVAAPNTISGINEALGVADGDPGSVVTMNGGPDGPWYDVIAPDQKTGELGKVRKKVTPMQLLAIAGMVFNEKQLTAWIGMSKAKNAENTKMNISNNKVLAAFLESKTPNPENDLKNLEDAAKAMKLADAAQVNADVAKPGTRRTDSKLWPGQTYVDTGHQKTYDRNMRIADKGRALADRLMGEDGDSSAPPAPSANAPANMTGRVRDDGALEYTFGPNTREVADTPTNRALLKKSGVQIEGGAKVETKASVAEKKASVAKAPTDKTDKKPPFNPKTDGPLKAKESAKKEEPIDWENTKDIPRGKVTTPVNEQTEGPLKPKEAPKKETPIDWESTKGIPRGKTTKMNVKEANTYRKTILNRLEKAHRMPRTDMAKKKALVKEIRSELASFNKVYPPN